jgi:glycosyltransferase involved in cell wall biosynthesis
MTYHAKRIIAVIPARNERKTIGSVVMGLRPYVSEVIVVDDCSSDGSGEQAREAGALVLRNEVSQGYDASIDAGFIEAARLGADILLTIDADGEHDAEDVPRVLAPIQEDRADITAGQRLHTTHFAEKVFALYSRLSYGVGDPLCGLKAYRRSVYDSVGHFDTVRSIGTELMLKGLRKGFRLALVPIVIHPRENDSSRFYARRIRANFKIFRAMLKVMFA